MRSRFRGDAWRIDPLVAPHPLTEAIDLRSEVLSLHNVPPFVTRDGICQYLFDDLHTLKGAMDTQGPRKRKRSAVACTRCHDRKVRCSAAFQGIPCANCAQDGTTCTIYQAHSV
jgi:hypothetical protein